ncbi:unnamed protein product [Effrenium voratum]|uniref:Uncharacterized protein n=1 Tax=Effrenium voratum TaxID=2562239 RepID=A0AA36N9N2_9DINO|nr:unnamed protein product [Effrenium voratum]|mmetsp:Transcript_131921/g.312700  ORF Transcript_131921/g.312700 Transcript_131921/m.312700 type:complete len:116 (-) Transcript_131921:376-723(-)
MRLRIKREAKERRAKAQSRLSGQRSALKARLRKQEKERMGKAKVAGLVEKAGKEKAKVPTETAKAKTKGKAKALQPMQSPVAACLVICLSPPRGRLIEAKEACMERGNIAVRNKI